MFGHPLIVVCGSQTLHEVLVKNEEHTFEHPDHYVNKEFFERSGILGAFGEIWRMQRIFAIATLKSIDSGSSNLESRVLTEVEEFITQAEKFGGQSFKINDLVNIYHYNIVSSLIFGKRFKHGDATLKRLIELISEAVTNTAHQAPTSVLPCLRFLPGDKFKVKRHRHVVDGILDIMQKAVDEHKKIPEEPNSTDIIYSFFKEQERRKQNNEDLVGFTDRDLLIMGYGLLFGGLGAPHTLQWSVLYLMHYPEVVSRMQKEIEENIENDRFPNMEDKPRLPFCQAVGWEVLRIASVVYVAPSHASSSDLTINGYTIPKGAYLLPALCSVNMDPTIFKEPNTFNPSRFINEDGQLFGFENVKTSFSLGPRNCLGQWLAEMEIFLFITTIVQKFDIENEADTPVPSLEGIYKGIHVTGPYNVCLKKRVQ